MAKEFNPDAFLQETAPIAEAQAEIERKNAERTAAGQPPLTGAEAQPNLNPSGPMNAPIKPSFSEAPGQYMVNNVVAPAFGVYKAAKDNPAEAAALGYGASYIPGVNKLPGISTIKAGREAASNILNKFGGAPSAAPTASAPMPGSSSYPIGGGPSNVPPTQQPGVIQRGMDYASKMRQMAANRVVGFGASGAAVPAGVAAGGAAATGIAGGQMAAMTPEQRKAYYDSMMLGAMSGDAGLAAAIMNRGQ
jgi:hypothetical protein